MALTGSASKTLSDGTKVFAGQGYLLPENQSYINLPVGDIESGNGLVMGFPRSAEPRRIRPVVGGIGGWKLKEC